jgi:energy-coupling factor transport system permease protein
VDLYLDRNTALHRLDPRVKTIGLLAAFAVALAFNHPGYVAAVAAAILLLAAAGRCLVSLWRLRAIFVLLFAFSSALWPLMLRGSTEVARLGPLSVSREPLLYGLAVGLRLDAMVAAGLVFLSTTRVEEFTAALRRLGLPFPASFAFSLAFRFVPTFADSAYTIIQAQRSRGLDLDSGGSLTRLRRHIPLLIPAILCAVRNTDLLAMALESRGFGPGRAGRSEYLEVRMGWGDVLVLLALAAAVGAAIWWRTCGHGAVLPRL